MYATQLKMKHAAAVMPGPRRRALGLQVKAISTPATPGGRPAPVNREPDNKVYKDKTGNKIKPMPADFGFRSGGARLYEEHYGEVPKSMGEMMAVSVEHEFGQVRAGYRFKSHFADAVEGKESGLDQALRMVSEGWTGILAAADKGLEDIGLLPKLEEPAPLPEAQKREFMEIRKKLSMLKLDCAGVHRREEQRIAMMGELDTPGWLKNPFLALSWTLDRVYAKAPIPKFWVLETVARVPYFAYASILHLYESVGFWRAGAELRKVHFAEEWNELHHLQIMESLGGDQAWFDRFFAQHAAIAYYWCLIFLYIASPKVAYNFMQRVEHHASDTYSEFLETNREILASIPPPKVALKYYHGADLYLFDEFQTGNKGVQPRRPDCNNLLDVFINIRDDENEHVKTMKTCQDMADK